MTQFCNSLGETFFVAERLFHQHDVLYIVSLMSESSEEQIEVDHTDWPKLLRLLAT